MILYYFIKDSKNLRKVGSESGQIDNYRPPVSGIQDKEIFTYPENLWKLFTISNDIKKQTFKNWFQRLGISNHPLEGTPEVDKIIKYVIGSSALL